MRQRMRQGRYRTCCFCYPSGRCVATSGEDRGMPEFGESQTLCPAVLNVRFDPERTQRLVRIAVCRSRRTRR